MPLIIRDINWEETDSQLVLHIPMKGAKASNVTVLGSDKYLKISFPPFFCEVYFHDLVDDNRTNLIVKNGFVEVTLTKVNQGKWNKLLNDQSEDKEIMKQIREEALNRISQKEQEKNEAKSTLLNKNKREAVREQMKIDEEERNRIDTIKKSEREKVDEEMKQFQENQKLQRRLAIEQHVKTTEQIDDLPKKEEINVKTIFNDSSSNKKVIESRPIVPLRESGRIAVNFTARVFPTPMRESQTEAEEEWLRKQVESRQAVHDLELDLTENEKDIDYLKSKANQFVQQGNFQSAIGVYNHAVRIFPKVPLLYLNRAVCHFQVRNMMKCVEDCSRALELLNPPVLDNLPQRIKAHVRRGTAFCELQLYAEGLMDYEAAQKLSPDDQNIREDAQKNSKFSREKSRFHLVE